MTTATTNTVLDHTTDAGFRTWVAEIITMLVTTLGVTQTADTGQINTATVTRPGSTLAAGYSIFRFNDTAQATSPIFIKLEYGTGNALSSPALWITIGTGSNGSGTLTGTVNTRVAASNFTAPSSTSSAFVTAGCYNTTAGFLGFVWKINGTAVSTIGMGGFCIFRSADNTGAVTTDAVMLMTNSTGAAGSSNGGVLLATSYLTNTAYNNSGAYNSAVAWGIFPFQLLASLFSANSQVGPIFQYTPVLGITPWVGLALQAEWAMNVTNSVTIVGSTPHTYRQIGGPGGCSTYLGIGSLNFGIFMLWE